MADREDHVVYESSVRFDENRIRAAAIYCSDGRFGEHFDDFLHNCLQLPRYDRLALPGGAACLAGHFLTFWEEVTFVEQLRFLVKVHGLERVVLVAHQGCAFYSERLHVAPSEMETRQREDMRTAIERVHSIAPGLLVDAFFAQNTRTALFVLKFAHHDDARKRNPALERRQSRASPKCPAGNRHAARRTDAPSTRR